jgi:PAS domain S-box-containing protein
LNAYQKLLTLNTTGFFETFFNNARYNGILLMKCDGEILDVNEAFHLRFGYLPEDLIGKNFSILFTENDRAIKKPESELQTVQEQGSANDENYIVHKDGSKLWVTGESVLIRNKDRETCIVKVVHNIHAQKQLERFLLKSHEFIESIFDSITDSALLLLDSSIRVNKVNRAFIKMFKLQKEPVKGSRLSDINNAFWARPDVKQGIVNFIVTEKGGTKTYEMEMDGENIKLNFQGKLIEGVAGNERKLLIMIKAAE